MTGFRFEPPIDDANSMLTLFFGCLQPDAGSVGEETSVRAIVGKTDPSRRSSSFLGESFLEEIPYFIH